MKISPGSATIKDGNLLRQQGEETTKQTANTEASSSYQVTKPSDTRKDTAASSSYQVTKPSDTRKDTAASSGYQVTKPSDTTKHTAASSSYQVTKSFDTRKHTAASSSYHITKPSDKRHDTAASSSYQIIKPSDLRKQTAASSSYQVTKPSDTKKKKKKKKENTAAIPANKPSNMRKDTAASSRYRTIRYEKRHSGQLQLPNHPIRKKTQRPAPATKPSDTENIQRPAPAPAGWFKKKTRIFLFSDLNWILFMSAPISMPQKMCSLMINNIWKFHQNWISHNKVMIKNVVKNVPSATVLVWHFI